MTPESKNVPKWTIRKPILWLGVIVLLLWVIVIIFTYRGQLPTGHPATRAAIHNSSPEPARKTPTAHTPSPSHDASSLSITLHGPAVHGVNALLTDSQGRTTGIKPGKTEGTTVENNDIPNSETYGEAIADPQTHVPASDAYRTITINNLLNEDYELDISGGPNTPYDLYVTAISPDNLQLNKIELHGKTRAGAASRYSISYGVGSGNILDLVVTESPAMAAAKLPR